MNKKVMLIPILALLLMTVPMVLALDVDVDGDDVTSTTIDFTIGDGSLSIVAWGIDTSSWNPGELGNRNEFYGEGSFTGTYSVSQGTYGGLAARINVDSSSYAEFYFDDYQDFDVLVANHYHGIEGWFGAYAEGDGATMNLKTAASMYVWSEATNPWSADCLGGNFIGKYVRVEDDDVLQAHLSIEIETDGYATMSNSNSWGWATYESGSATTSYGGGTRTISATGDGFYLQEAVGLDYLEFNGFEMLGGGNAESWAFFNDGFSGEYSMSGD